MKTNILPRSGTAVLNRLLDPLARNLTPEFAQVLVKLRIDQDSRARIDELAEKCNEGLLTDDERQEYEDYVRGGDLITVLQSKARQFLLLRNDRKVQGA